MQKLQFLIYFKEKSTITIYFIFQNDQFKIICLINQNKYLFNLQIIYMKENKIAQ